MDPLAHRVASRYLQAVGGDALLHKAEAAVYRGEAMLHAAAQQHKFWARTMTEGNFEATDKAYQRILSFLKSYQHEITSAMADLDSYEQELSSQESHDYDRASGF